MIRKISLLVILPALLLALSITGCRFASSGDEAYAPYTPPDDLGSAANEATVSGNGDGVGLAFFRAWEGDDYLGMYSLLSPQSQALVESDSFVARYQEAMETAAVQAIHAQPLSSFQDGRRTVMDVRITWESAVIGDIVRDHTVELVYDRDRWGVIWHEGLILPELAGGNRLSMEYRVPARANIYDTDGSALAFQGTAIALGVIPGEIVEEEALLAVLSPILNQTPDALKERYAQAGLDWFVPIGEVSSDIIQDNYSALQPFIGSGLLIENTPRTRLYSEQGLAAHTIGYVGSIPPGQVNAYRAAGYRGDELVGLTGVEAWGEEYLSGTHGGTLTVIGPNGDYVNTIGESEPRQARSLYLSLVSDFQEGVEKALEDALITHPLGNRGAIVVLDIDSGAVLAMSSYPAYDPRLFDVTRTTSNAELQQILSDPSRPLVNRATQGEYPAGSIFKLVTFTAGVNSGVFTPESRYTSTGTWSGLGPNFVKTDWREGGHGTVSLAQAIVVSCNSCFYEVGLQVDGVDSFFFPEIARQFGFGSPTGIAGVPEAGGLIPDPEWKISVVGEGWVPGDAVNMAIGQGYVLVTPLQIANMMAAIANDGTIMQPTVIDRIGPGGGAPEESWPAQVSGQLPLSPEQLAVIQDNLLKVTTSGSGTATDKFQTLSIPVAGKTGTAETTPGNESHAWFAGYAPATPHTLPNGATIDKPEIAIAVIVENAGEGSVVAAPIFRRVVELYYGITPLTPYPWTPPEPVEPTPTP